MKLNGKVAVVTGAGSGIGRCLAVCLAERGVHLAISDVDDEGLRETGAIVSAIGVHVTQQHLDVSSLSQMRAHRERVLKDHGHVDVVINNAGVSVNRTLERTSYEDMEWLLGVNLWGVIYGSKEFLPHLKDRPEAHLCNISSVHGLFTNRQMGAYCTSKFAVRGFTQTLAQELRGSEVVVSCAHPGGVRTRIAANARQDGDPEQTQRKFDRWRGRMSAESAAEAIVRGIERGDQRMLVGFDAHLYDWAARTFPRGWQRLMGALPTA